MVHAIKRIYGDRARLLLADTDSLLYKIRTENIYEDLWEIKGKIDFSDCPNDSRFKDDPNKKIPGLFKDENHGVPMKSFVGLKSKMYSYVMADNTGNKRAKGIKRSAIRDIRHKDYRRTLLDGSRMHHKMRVIKSSNHKLGSYEINKVSLIVAMMTKGSS